MRLTLRSHSSPLRPACAAFLRGTDPAAWLREIGRWGLAAGQLRCYLVPESIHSIQPAGLFVVLSSGELPADVLAPYGVEAGRLYLPVNACLWPATTPPELGAALLWPRQLLHPGIGLVGFDTPDELDLGTLLDCGLPRATAWDRARPGAPTRPRLRQIRMLPPTAAEVVQSIQADVGSRPLQELPGLAEAKTGRVQAVLDSVRRRLLRFTLGLLKRRPSGGGGMSGGAALLGLLGLLVGAGALLLSVAGSLGSPNGSALPFLLMLVLMLVLRFLRSRDDAAEPVAPRAPRAPGALDRLEGRLGTSLQGLEQKRQNEIERLLRLFGENLDEALKYAIPLGGPYQDRGTAPPSGWLGARLAEFSLSSLGGGYATDVWNLDNYRHSLHQQYNAAARQEEAAGRFKKAAYIYAHLLGNFWAAAAALEKGGFFREAAALHKDHLKNLPAAAECLERGLLLYDAAELYAGLGQHEKAGDLHTRLEQPGLAARHYERAVEQLLGNDDHPAAARLLADKLAAPDRAREVLLQGWDGPKQPETCLAQYFTLVANEADTGLSAHVQAIYQHRTPPGRHLPLLQVLASLNAQQPDDEALQTTSRGIAYEVVSTEAGRGNLTPLALLRHFQPHDRLIAADCSRYTSHQPRRPAPDPLSGLKSLQLDASITWYTAVTHRQQWVALGRRDDRLHLARGNWYGNLEYYSWATLASAVGVVLVADEQHSTRILLYASEPLTLATHHLQKNKNFPEALTVECPSWLPPSPAAVCLLPDNRLATMEVQEHSAVIQRFEADGRAMAPMRFQMPEAAPAYPSVFQEWPVRLLYRDGRYIACWANWLVWVDEKGQSGSYELGQPVSALVSSPYAPQTLLALGMEDFLQFWTPGHAARPDPGPRFQTNSGPDGDLQFVGPEHLVTTDDDRAKLFRFDTNGVYLLRTIDVKTGISAVLPTSSRQHFALLEASGTLTLHRIDPE